MALNPDMTFWINTLIFNKLSDICPSLSLNGEDRKVFDICKVDFKSYMNYLDRNHLKVDGEFSVPDLISPDNVVGQIISMIIENTTGLPQALKSAKEVEEFIDMWVKMWWKKWIQRTKILFTKEDMPKQMVSAVPITSNVFTVEEYNDIIFTVIDKFIQYGELCCPTIMAEGLIKKEVDDKGKTVWTIEEKLSLIPKLRRRAKELAYTHGPLVFLKPDNYYKLREWRDDSDANRIV